MRPRGRTRPENEVGTILVAVAARLRSGMEPAQAWTQSLQGQSRTIAEPLQAQIAPSSQHRPRVRGPAAATAAIDSALAARDVAGQLGAELADVLETCAAGIEEAGRAAADRSAALGGPRATARLLGWLPLGGLVVGTGMGADPLGWLLGTGWGWVTLAAATGLTAAGHLWIRKLIRMAERA